MPPKEKLRYSCTHLHWGSRVILIAVLTILPLLLVVINPAEAAINQTINFQSKIVNKSNGLNLSAGSPACVKDGSGNDTCDFRVRIWNDPTGTSETSGTGNLLFSQTFEDVEIGEANGIFNLTINSCGSSQYGDSEWGTSVGDCTVVDDSDSDSDPGVNFDRDDLYLEIGFAPADTASSLGSFTELFSRKAFTSVPSALHAQNSSALGGLSADGFVQLSPSSAQSTGDTSNPLIYLNEDGTGTPNLLQLQVAGSDQLLLTNGGDLGLGVASPDAYLDIKAATSSSAQLNLTSSSGVNPSTPVAGDLWFNGTNLNFYNGSTTTDILAGGGGGSSLFTDGGATSYLTDTADDLAIGGTGLASPFSVDVSANTVRIGSGATANAVLGLYASDGDTGQIEYTTDDRFEFSGGDMLLADDLSLFFGSEADVFFRYDETTDDRLEFGYGANQFGYIDDVASETYGDFVFAGTTTLGGDLTGSETALTINTGTGFTGTLLDINVDGSDIFTISTTGITAEVPAAFNAGGNVSIAEDLVFTNGTASNIISDSPLYITAGDASADEDLVLSANNDGYVVVDDRLEVSDVIHLGNSSADNFLAASAQTNAATDDLYWGDKMICDASETNCGWSTSAGILFTDGGSVSYLTSTTDDFAIGGSTLASAFSVDVSDNLVRIGTGSTTNATVDLYASDADTGRLQYTTDDLLALTGGDLFIGATSSTISTGFTAGGDDLFVAGDVGVEGNIFSDGDLTLQTDIDTTGAGDITISFGGTNTETLAWNATNDAFIISDDFLPSADDTYDLGSSSNRWQDLYLGPSSLHIGTDGDEGIISFDTATNSFGFDADGDSTPEIIFNDAGDLTLDGNLSIAGDILPDSSPALTATTQTITAVDSTDNVGQYVDTVIGTDGLLVASYYDATNGDLKVLHCGNAACDSGNTVTTVSSTDDVGQYSSIDIGTNGYPTVAYYNATDGDIEVVTCGNESCSSGNSMNSITSADDIGSHLDMVIGSDGYPIISYHDNTNQDAEVVHCGNAACSSGNTSTDLYTSGDQGEYSSVAIATTGYPMVTWYDTTGYTRRARCSNLSCTSFATNYLGGSAGGTYNDTILNSEGFIMGAHKMTSGTPRTYTCADVQCESMLSPNENETDDVGDVSLAITKEGFPLMSYYETGSDDLKVNLCEDSQCSDFATSTVVDSTDDVGMFNSIEVATDGLPIIAYYDNTAGDLKVLKCANMACDATSSYDYTGGINLGSSENFFNNIYGVSINAQDLAVNNFDVAEEYFVEDSTIAAGDVVRLKKDSDNQLVVERTQDAQDGEVIGVISTEPGLYLKDWQNNHNVGRPVALAGRVPVKVSDENGPIKRGDFLTPASTPGYAMKATEGGMIIGRAMEDFDPEQTTEEGDSALVDVMLEAATQQAEEQVQEMLDEGEISEMQAEEFVEEFDAQVADELDLEEETEIILDELQNGEDAEVEVDPNDLPEEATHLKGRIMMFVDLGYAPDEQFGIKRDEMVKSFDVDYFSLANGDNLFDVIDNPASPSMTINVDNLILAGSVVIEGDLSVHGQVTAAGAKVGSLEVENRLYIESGENEVAGKVTMSARETGIWVNNSLVTDNSSIHLTADQFVDHRVVNIERGVGFKIEIAEPVDAATTFNYLIIN